MTDHAERIAVVLEALDQRMSAMDVRFVRMEGHLADDAQATEEAAKHLGKIAESFSKLQELYVALDEKMDQHIAVMQNFITETQRLRTSSQRLISEVRKRA